MTSSKYSDGSSGKLIVLSITAVEIILRRNPKYPIHKTSVKELETEGNRGKEKVCNLCAPPLCHSKISERF